MNWLDVLLLAAIGFSAYRGYRNGFIRELVAFASVILAIPIAGVLYDDLFPKVEPITDSRVLAALISFLALLAGVIVGGQVVAHLLKRTAEALNLGVLDRTAGLAFGFLKAMFTAQVVLLALVTFPNPDLREAIHGSPVAMRLLDAAPGVLAFLPAGFEEARDIFADFGKETGILPDGTPVATP